MSQDSLWTSDAKAEMLDHPVKFLYEVKENSFVFANIQQHLNDTKPSS